MIQLTPVIKKLIIINVIIFFAIKISPPEFAMLLPMQSFNSQGFYPSQLVTSMFTHFDLTHIFFNMLGLLFLGPLIEMTVGPKKTLITYLLGGLISCVIYLIYYSFIVNQGGFFLLGASGSVFALLVLCATYHPNQTIQLIFPPIRLKLGVAVLIFVSLDYILLFKSGTNVAHLAHLGGAALGGFLGYLWNK